jgi:hypothetical protein
MYYLILTYATWIEEDFLQAVDSPDWVGYVTRLDWPYPVYPTGFMLRLFIFKWIQVLCHEGCAAIIHLYSKPAPLDF